MPKEKCFHCGEDCGPQPIYFEGKSFCCNGCKSVFQILNKNKLYKYYEFEESPGLKDSAEKDSRKWAFLETEEIANELLEFDDGGISRINFFVPSIHCSSCIWLLENLQKLNEGIVLSKVNFPKKQVEVTFKKEFVSLRNVAALMDSIGYPPNISMDEESKKKNPSVNKQLLYKLGVAGFCFGNIMLLSFPEYFSKEFMAELHYLKYFGWLNLLLAIPVFVYSSSGYFISVFKSISKGYINIDLPVALGILALFFRSAYEVVTGVGAGFADSLAGLVFFLLIGRWYQDKTYRALSFERDYKAYFPIAVPKLSKEGVEYLPVQKLKKGDVVQIRNEELIPADAVLKKGNANIDYSFVTGESLPIVKNVGDTLFAGGKQMGTLLEVELLKGTTQSRFIQLWNKQNVKSQQNLKIQQALDKVSQYFTVIVLAIAFSATVFWYFVDKTHILNAFTSVLIIACPCALALSVPFAYGSVMRFLGSKGIFLRESNVVENLSKANAIVFDKTGTITYPNAWEVDWIGEELSVDQKTWILSTAYNSSHPLDQALVKNYGGLDILTLDEFRSLTGEGVIGMIKSHEIKLGTAGFVNQASPSNSGTKVHLEIDGSYLGYFLFRNKYREGLEEAVGALKKKFELHLLTGDNEGEKSKLLEIFGGGINLQFNQKPSDKLDFIQGLKERGKKVVMIGDGLNDAGALSASNVGISIVDSVYQFSPASDIIYSAEMLSKIKNVFQFTKAAKRIVYASFTISFLYNIIGVSFAVSGNLTPLFAAILMPLSSVSVVAFATFSAWIAYQRFLKGN